MIQLTDHWAFSDRAIRQPKVMAGCGRNGHSLYFFAPIVDVMPTHHVEELVAHELAQAVLYAKGERLPADRTPPRWFDQIESMADEIMELWGFDPDAVDVWVQQNWNWASDKRAKGKKRK
jgi:hypothetical protein